MAFTDVPLVLEPSQPATHTIIWLHGLGADGHDFFPVGQLLLQATKLPIRFIFPHAPLRAISCMQHQVMRAWSDIYALSADAKQDRHGFMQTFTSLDKLIQEQYQQGIPYAHIFLAGYSQGCAAALFTGLRYPQRLAGLIGWSGYLPLANELGQEISLVNQNMPIFLAHGDKDLVVPFAWGEMSHEYLQQLHYSVTWRVYPIGHQVCEEEIQEVGEWINRIINKKP